MSTLLHSVLIQIVVHYNPFILQQFLLSCVSRFQPQFLFPSYLFSPASKLYRDNWFSLSIYENQLTEEKSMQSSIDTCRISVDWCCLHQFQLRAHWLSKNKLRPNRVLEVFDFKHYLSGLSDHWVDAPDGTSVSMGLSGVSRNILIWFWYGLGVLAHIS